MSPRRLLGGSIVVVLLLTAPLLLDSFGLFLAATIFALGLYGAAFDLLYGYTGLLSFGHSVFFGVGAYAATVAISDGGTGTVAALALAFLVAMVVAVGLGVIAIRVTSHGFVIVTILIALVAHLLATSWTAVTGGTDGRTVVVPPVTVPGLGDVSLLDPVARYYFVLAVLTLSLLILWRLVASPVGLAFRLVRDNERRARLLGYNVSGYKLAAFAASGAFAGLAGALSMMVAGFASAADFSIIVAGDPIIFTLVGGRGTLVGALIGAGIVQVATTTFSEFTNAYPLFIGALLVVTVVLEPAGLVGIGRRLGDRLTDSYEGSNDD